MKRLLLTSLTLFIYSLNVSAQTPCSGGTAGSYPCDGLDLQDYISASDMNADEAQDSWGWTDPLDGKEYAIVALDNGTAFVDISTPTNIRYLGRMNSHSGGSNLWRDVKTYNNHAFVVSEVTSDGMQVFDLTRLRGLSTSPTGGGSRTFSEDAFLFIGDGGSNDGRAHNIVINEDSGYAYIVGVNRSSNSSDGPLFVDISNPTSPSIVGEYGPSDYFHDAQVVTYDGPDPDYQGKEIMIGCNENNMVIVDVTNKSAPSNIATIAYSNVEYTHQGWFTEDKRFFLVGDELDEDNLGIPTRTLVFDLEDLDNPSLHYTYSGPTSAIDHNGYVRGNRFYLANYAAGMRILKIDGLYDATPSMTEINYFDTYPLNNNAAFNGVWNVYPYFESGNLVVSGFGRASINGDGGLFIIKDPLYDNTDPTAVCQNITVTLDRLTGTASITAADLDGGSTDDFGIVASSITNGQTTFTCDDVGDTFNVTLTVEDDYGNESSCVAQVTVAAETTAFTGATWSNGTPSIGSNAKISSNYNTASDGGSIDACTCEVDASRTLTIEGGDYLNITQDITVNGTLVVEHQGSVVQSDDSAVTTNNGTINVNLTTPNLASRDFMVLGSPMSTETRESVWSSAFLVLEANTIDFVPHPDVTALFPGAENFADDNNDFWTEVVTGTANPGEGYIVRPQAGYGQPGGIFNYTYDDGTLNTGDVDFTVIQNTPGPTAADNKNASPNVLANPYPSAIWADDLINANAM
ncbi:choice-of-anchor B family protein, partial [Aureisphaera sp.]